MYRRKQPKTDKRQRSNTGPTCRDLDYAAGLMGWFLLHKIIPMKESSQQQAELDAWEENRRDF